MSSTPAGLVEPFHCSELAYKVRKGELSQLGWLAWAAETPVIWHKLSKVLYQLVPIFRSLPIFLSSLDLHLTRHSYWAWYTLFACIIVMRMWRKMMSIYIMRPTLLPRTQALAGRWGKKEMHFFSPRPFEGLGTRLWGYVHSSLILRPSSLVFSRQRRPGYELDYTHYRQALYGWSDGFEIG